MIEIKHTVFITNQEKPEKNKKEVASVCNFIKCPMWYSVTVTMRFYCTKPSNACLVIM